MKIFRNILIVSIILCSCVLFSVTVFSSDDSNEQVIIRLGHGSAESNDRHKAILHFKDLVEEKSNGSIEVLIYPNEQLGSEAAMIESLSFNNLQMVVASSFSQFDERISVFELPYLFDSKEQAWSILDGKIGQEVAEPLLDYNIRILSYFENGFRHITSDKPINEPADLRGLKIRTPEIPMFLQTFEALGAGPTPMAFGELYMALQQGTVDAQENPLSTIYASRFNEVQSHLILMSHQYMPLPAAISDEFWHSLTKEQQDIIESSAHEAADFHRTLTDENESVILNELKEAGMTIIEPDQELFSEKVEVVYDNYRTIFGDALIDSVLDAIQYHEEELDD